MYAIVQIGVGMDLGSRIFLPAFPLLLMLLQINAWSSFTFWILFSSALSSISMYMPLTSNSSSFWLVVVGGAFVSLFHLKLLYLLTDADAMFENTILFPGVLHASFIVAWNSCYLK